MYVIVTYKNNKEWLRSRPLDKLNAIINSADLRAFLLKCSNPSQYQIKIMEA